MTEEPADWRELREFAGVELAQSFVLSWHLEAESLLIDADVQLAAEHPFYERPRPKERVCIRAAAIEFPYCAAVATGNGAPRPAAEVLGTLGAGRIDGLQCVADGRYRLEGEFGRITIDAERPLLRIRNP